jgi:hypothetical protein
MMEEWSAHFAEIPGEVGRWLFSFGCVIAAYKISAPEKLTLNNALLALDRVLGIVVFPGAFLFVMVLLWLVPSHSYQTPMSLFNYRNERKDRLWKAIMRTSQDMLRALCIYGYFSSLHRRMAEAKLRTHQTGPQ